MAVANACRGVRCNVLVNTCGTTTGRPVAVTQIALVIASRELAGSSQGFPSRCRTCGSKLVEASFSTISGRHTSRARSLAGNAANPESAASTVSTDQSIDCVVRIRNRMAQPSTLESSRPRVNVGALHVRSPKDML